MAVNILTKEDLGHFKNELFNELTNFLQTAATMRKRWFKANETMKYLNISRRTLHTLRANGEIPYTRLGGIIYYDLAKLEKMLIENCSPKHS